MVIWIIGKSGAGKTFLSKNLFKKLKKKFKKIIWIDGDKFRKKYCKDLGYTIKDRKKNSKRIQDHCKLYEKKKFVVICSILSIFRDHQKKNRKLFSNYIQIFIKSNFSIIKKRNNKYIYNKKYNVVGKDIAFPEPYKSHLIVKNNFDSKFLLVLKKIESLINEKL